MRRKKKPRFNKLALYNIHKNNKKVVALMLSQYIIFSLRYFFLPLKLHLFIWKYKFKKRNFHFIKYHTKLYYTQRHYYFLYSGLFS
jgi:hypothetical protein